MSEDTLLKEYYNIFDTVNDFDKRLLTVKGWGVTLSLAALGWGFQYKHYGLFLVAALSGLAFWLIEGTMKRHQMRYYIRMREIEIRQYDRITEENTKILSSPRIDSSWNYARKIYWGKEISDSRPLEVKGLKLSYLFAWFMPHVALPHIISFVAGLLLFYYGYKNCFGDMTW